MNTVSRIRCGLALLAGAIPSFGLGPPSPQATPKNFSPLQQLEKHVKSLPTSRTLCGAVVMDAASGQTLFEFNPRLPLIPASNAKLFVLAASLDLLGPEFEFRTVLGKVGDDLIVMGAGDPAFGDPRLCEARGEEITAEFQRWADALMAQGVTQVRDLILDESIFDDQFAHPGWETSDLQKWYGAPVGALNLNDNCVEITIRPAKKAGSPVLWDVVPPNTLVTLDNRCRSGGKGEPIIQRSGADFRYLVSGRCPKPWPFPPLAVPDPGALFGDALRTFLKQHGVMVQGSIRRIRDHAAIDVSGMVPLADHVTPMTDVLARIGKDSQNVFAECLLKRLGYEWRRRQSHPAPVGSWESGREAIMAFLAAQTEGVPGTDSNLWSGLILDDASGLSRSNRATAAQLAFLLCAMHHHPSGSVFADSLSAAGRDGSLAKRDRLKPLAGSLFGKTGTLRGVRSLSGYLDTRSGRRLAFCILMNDENGSTGPLSDWADRFCQILTDWPGP